MRTYAELMEMSDKCERKAHKVKGALRAFWHNASIGFKKKALNAGSVCWGKEDGRKEALAQ